MLRGSLVLSISVKHFKIDPIDSTRYTEEKHKGYYMQSQKRKKIAIIAGVGLLIVTIGVVVGISLLSSSDNEELVSVDEKKHIGVDKVLTLDEVKKALGDLGSKPEGPTLSGTLTTPELRGETAAYEFTTLKGKRAVIDVEARKYPSKEELDKSEPFKDTASEKLEGIDADKARYLLTRSISADDRVALVATKGATVYTFRVEQNANEGVDINQLAAKRIVLRLAKSADFDAVK